jgi:SAM-dependent methyltransferase
MSAASEIPHPDGIVHLEELEGGRRRLQVAPRRPGLYIRPDFCVTAYPDDLIRLILEVKGPADLCREIMREEDPTLLRRHLILTMDAHLDSQELIRRRLLDFGCGAGASTVILGRSLPGTEIVGVDVDGDDLRVARARVEFYRLPRVTFVQLVERDRLPEGLGPFHTVVLSAVFESLLPEERKTLMPQLWDLIEPGGVLLLDEVPARWFPVEVRASGLPLINFLPAPLAGFFARRCSRRVGRQNSWTDLRRKGIRGATIRAILRTLPKGSGKPVLLPPYRHGYRSRVDLWYDGYSGGEEGRMGVLRRMLFGLLRWASAILGTPLVPYLSVAVRKPWKSVFGERLTG